MSGWDYWRIFNSLGALIAFGYALWRMLAQWEFFISSERVRWLSFLAFLFTAFYAPFEVVFLPDLNFRLPLFTGAIIWAQVSLVLEPRFTRKKARHRDRR